MTIHIPMFPPPLLPVSGRYNDHGFLIPPPLPLPNETPLQALARLRDEAAFEIERLLAFLDATDGDPDLELSVTNHHPDYNTPAFEDAERDDCDLEPDVDAEDDDPREACGDDEPSLGSVDRFVGDRLSMQIDQSMWSAGTTDDREMEPLSI